MKRNGATVILFSEDFQKVFLVWRTDYPVWDTTGGAIEDGEEPKVAAVREAKEETNFDIEISNLLVKYIITSKNGDQLNGYLYKGKVKGGEYKPEFVGNIGKWFYVNKLPMSMSKMSRRMIQDALKSEKEEVPINIEIKNPSFFDYIHIILLHPIFVIRNLRRMLSVIQ